MSGGKEVKKTEVGNYGGSRGSKKRDKRTEERLRRYVETGLKGCKSEETERKSEKDEETVREGE